MKVDPQTLGIKEARISEILQKLKINREMVVVAKNGVITPESEKAQAGDELEIITVVSGG